jgi:hypothetical protein
MNSSCVVSSPRPAALATHQLGEERVVLLVHRDIDRLASSRGRVPRHRSGLIAHSTEHAPDEPRHERRGNFGVPRGGSFVACKQPLEE